MKGRRCIAAILAVAISATAVGSAGAAPASASKAPAVREKEQQLQEIRKELVEKRQGLQQARRRERGVLRDLHRIEDRHERLVAERDRLAVQLRGLTKSRAATAIHVMATERVLAANRTKLAGRLHDIHRFGRIGYLDVLLGARDFAEFLTRFYFLGRIVSADAALIADTEQQQKKWQALSADLADETRQVETVAGEVSAREQDIRVEEAAKRDLFRRVKRERIAFEQVVEDLEQESRQLEALIQKLAGTVPVVEPRIGLRILQGMLWPARGQITSRFGLRVHPIFAVRKMHTGVDIAGPLGTPVYSAAAGKVLYTGWFGGYGKIVVIDHGSGVSTLYGHLSAILVGTGTNVPRGAVVGRIGSTGYSTGPHLHFEVRVNGRPVNPIGR